MSIGAVAVALLLSPFASSYPDGLEWVAAKYEFAHSQAPAFTGFLAGYELPHVRSAFWSKGLAGLLGATIVLAVALGVRRFIALDPWRPKSPAV
jgi:cobalt/nickel transport system permease protein